MKKITSIFNLETYDFKLPEELIAQQPISKRSHSRLLVLNKNTGQIQLASFSELKHFLPSGSLLVGNNAKVLPARILGHKETGGKVEFLLLTPFPLLKPKKISSNQYVVEAEGLLKASKRPKKNQKIIFKEDFYLIVKENKEFGQAKVQIFFQGNLKDKFIAYGHTPLPPYIRREDTQEDKTRYQTVYASEDKIGAVAAPTAGLHFTKHLKQELLAIGFDFTYITLYVGYGTFSPVRTKDIRNHQMHAEYFEISKKSAKVISQAKRAKRPIIAIGTTTVRTLEGAFALMGEIRPFSGFTDIFIYPGFKFKVIDHLITNFHLPKSSLIMLVSALAGIENIKRAYQVAIENKMRFFSYGDAMLIL
ncbi:tRNA preQ1(34) S-adenosylmethionine ribosyltransferase-isomerase QueA [Desulfonauticus submarinus]